MNLCQCEHRSKTYPTGSQSCWFWCSQVAKSIRYHDCGNWNVPVDGSRGMCISIHLYKKLIAIGYLTLW